MVNYGVFVYFQSLGLLISAFLCNLAASVFPPLLKCSLLSISNKELPLNSVTFKDRG